MRLQAGHDLGTLHFEQNTSSEAAESWSNWLISPVISSSGERELVEFVDSSLEINQILTDHRNDIFIFSIFNGGN